MEKQVFDSQSGTGATPRLVRVVGLFGLTAISLNGVIGSGIFVLPAMVAAWLGPASPVAYLTAALATILIVLCFAEAGSSFEQTGGPYLYAREAFGAFVGFEVGWMFLLTRLAAAAAISNAFTAYLGYFWPALEHGAGRVVAVTVLLFGLGWLNLIGIRYGAWVVNFLTVAKLLPLVLFISAGLFRADDSKFQIITLPDMHGLRQATLALIFAFGGFENASVPSEEIKDPRRNVPMALFISIGLTTVIYILIQIVALSTLPGLANDSTPLASAGRRFLGPFGATVITIGAIFSTTGSNSALMLVGPRIFYALGKGGQLPGALARVHEHYRTPYVAIILFMLLTWGIALFGTFAQLVALSAIARLLFSGTTCLAIPVLRRKMKTSAREFSVPGGIAIPAAAVAICVWLLAAISQTQAIAGLLGLLAGAIIYLLRELSPRGHGGHGE